MSKSAGDDQSRRPNAFRDDHTAASLADWSVVSPPPQQAPVARQRQQDPGNEIDARLSKDAYVSSLRRSIEQMTNGDVQPVREGLEELRRELDIDAEDNPVDG